MCVCFMHGTEGLKESREVKRKRQRNKGRRGKSNRFYISASVPSDKEDIVSEM